MTKLTVTTSLIALLAGLAGVFATQTPARADTAPDGCTKGAQPCTDTTVCIGLPDNNICSTHHWYEPVGAT